MLQKSMGIGLLFLLIPTLIFAGTTGKISGKVIDKETGQPLPGANVMVEGTTMGAAADLNGEYFILNIPPGKYSVKASMIGYTSVVQTNVQVRVDLTTSLIFTLSSEVLDMGQSVTVVAERPLIQKDLTASRKIQTAEEVMAAPVEDVQGAVRLTAGVTGNNFRGGRGGEAMYVLDGVALIDPMTGNYESDVPLMSLEEVSVMTGGFSAEYGNIQSGLVSMVTKEGGQEYHGAIRYKTNDLRSAKLNAAMGNSYTTLIDKKDNKMQIADFRRGEDLRNLEWSLGGPEPISKFLFGKPRLINFFVAGEFFDSHGRFPGEMEKKGSVNSKVTIIPRPGIKLAITGMRTWRDATFYYHSWKNTTYEADIDSTDESVVGRDYNGDGDMLDIVPGTDLNKNGFIGDAFSMLEHTPRFNYGTGEFSLSWTHTLSPKTFYEIKLSRFMTRMHYNVNERINEDLNGDGVFDPETEDLNGNGVWDWKVYGEDTDLFVDNNDNGFIDASEGNPRSEWLPWRNVPFGRTQDTESFYMYGYAPNLSFYRLRWNNDSKVTYSGKINFTSQVTNRQQIKAGFNIDYFEIKDHDVDLASGGNVYGQNIAVYPNQGAFYLQDKMEYEGMILNMGFRFDWFDANFDKYPGDPRRPVPDSLLSVGGVVANPTSVPAKFYWSPRIGVAYPFTERDLMFFSYGKYFQTPQLRFLYTNTNYDFSGAFPLVGNPNIDPERTTAYEIGWKHQFTADIVMNWTGYYKDITGLTDTEQMYYTFSDYYTRFVNVDYGNVRGFELEFYKRRSATGFISGSVNYTYSVAKGKSSSYRQNYNLTWAGDIIPTTESYLDWDERHAIKANFDVRVPRKRNLLGISLLNDAGINTIVRYGSGKPYTKPKQSKEPEINTERLPWHMTVDLTMDKQFDLGNNRRLTFFIWVNNLLNRRNINGIADTQWYYTFKQVQQKYEQGIINRERYMQLMDVQDPNDVDGDGNLEEADGEIDYNKKYPEVGRHTFPGVYGWGRTIRIGLRLEF